MEHFYQDLEGWFGFEKFYNQIKFFDGMHIVEIGCWKGKSSSCMAVNIVNSGKKVIFDCIDTWKGSSEHEEQGPELFEEFKKNMEPVKNFYIAKQMTSVDAAKTYANNSLDFVWIDASHNYDDVKNDILAWKPKVKIGGILGGDDYYKNWPGVIQAVDELILTKNTTDGPYWFTTIKS
jgi:predicted O-methyltransferase YrrM